VQYRLHPQPQDTRGSSLAALPHRANSTGSYSLASRLTMPAMCCLSLLLLRAGTLNNLTTAIGSLSLLTGRGLVRRRFFMLGRLRYSSLLSLAARQSCARLPVLVDDPALPDAAQKPVLADHRPRRLNQRHQHVERARRALSAIGEQLAAMRQDAEAAKFDDRWRVRQANHGRQL
jgi:hypothetical protein